MNLASRAAMDIEQYRGQLDAIRRQLTGRLQRQTNDAREVGDDQADPGDIAHVDELRDEFLALAHADSTTLNQVVAALDRIEDGSFGRCIVDGEPIEEKRLASVPWAAYCLKHQEEREQDDGLQRPTL